MSKLNMEIGSVPGTPAAGFVSVYPKSDKKLYLKDEDGTETDLTAAGGGGSVDDTAYDATSWNGVTTDAPSKNAVRDQVETMLTSIATKITASSTDTLTNKTFDVDGAGNVLSNIANANIKAAAGIAVNKLAALTASRAVASDGSGFLTASATTSTELGYVNGVTSAIQTQLNNVPYFSPRDGGRIVEDWMTGLASGFHAWLGTSNAGAVAISITAQSGTRTGVVNISTSTSGTAAPRLSSGGSNTHYSIGHKQMLFDTDIEIRTLSVVAEEYIIRVGLTDVSNNSTDPTNGMFFKYNRATNGDFWECITANAGTPTSTVTAVAVTANTYYKLKIWVNAAGTSVKFYIDNVLVATHATNIPTGTSKTLSSQWQMIKTNGTTARDMNVDLVILGWGTGAPEP